MKTKHVKWLSGAVALLGAWLIVSPFIFGATAELVGLISATVLTGIVIVALAGYNFYRASQGEPASRGAATVNVLAGIWVMASPYIIGMLGAFEVTEVAIANNLLIGAAIALLALANAWKGASVTRVTKA